MVAFIGCERVEHINAQTICWNDTDYTVTSEIVPAEYIGEQLDIIKKIVKEFPKENGEANSDIKVGTRLYRIKNENATEAIAMEYNKIYVKAVIMSRINK